MPSTQINLIWFAWKLDIWGPLSNHLTWSAWPNTARTMTFKPQGNTWTRKCFRTETRHTLRHYKALLGPWSEIERPCAKTRWIRSCIEWLTVSTQDNRHTITERSLKVIIPSVHCHLVGYYSGVINWSTFCLIRIYYCIVQSGIHNEQGNCKVGHRSATGPIANIDSDLWPFGLEIQNRVYDLTLIFYFLEVWLSLYCLHCTYMALFILQKRSNMMTYFIGKSHENDVRLPW